MNKRWSLFPIRDQEVWEQYQTHLSAFWTAEEIDLSSDRKDFEKLSKSEQNFIKFVLAFFASADAIVNQNIACNFINEFEGLEIKAFYSIQQQMEVVHQQTYGELIESIVSDDKERSKLFNAIENYPSIKEKAQWAFTYMNKKKSLQERLFAFIFVEGLQFQTSFASIYYFKKRNLMPGLISSNEFISRDEGLHAKFSACMFKRENANSKVVDQTLAEKIVREVVVIEKKFMDDALDVAIIGMNKKQMGNYIEFVADYFIDMAGFDKIYTTPNPFSFMEMISINRKTNFFEHRPSEYQLAGKKTEFTIDEDF